MSEIDIDETTGLPRLPDGYFWRVRKEGYSQYSFAWAVGGWIGQVSIYAKDEAQQWSDWSDRITKYRDGNRDYEYREIPAEKKKLFASRTRSLVRQERSRFSEREVLVHSSTEATDDNNPVSAKNILARCEEVIDAWNESIERKKIYGDYPPKRLGDDG